MGITDYFRPVQAWSAQEVREFLKNNDPDQYNLVDVRQPEEYEKGHLPGARLIPLLIVLGLGAGIWVTPVPAGVRPEAWRLLMEAPGTLVAGP